MTYDTLLFDFDHTLFDFDASEAAAFARTMAAHRMPDAGSVAETYQSINRQLWNEVEQGAITADAVRVLRFELLIEAVGIEADAEAMAHTFVRELGASGDLYPGAREILELLSASATLALVSNGLGAVQRARIDRLDIARYFGAIVISGEVGAAKPSREIFDITFERLGNPARSGAVMIGDSLGSDMDGGKNYGIDTCWYNPGQEPIPEGITHHVIELGDLRTLVGGT